MELRLLLHIKFNRPVDLEKDYIVAGGFEMVMNGKSVHFDFHNQYHNLVTQSPQEDIITLYNPDYSEFPEFRSITLDDLKNVTKINECFVFLGEPGESDLEVESVKNIYFTVIDDKYDAIAIDSKIIDDFNAETEKEKKVIWAAFTSVWDGDCITTPCKINTETKEIIYIQKSPVELRGSCEREFVTINDEDFVAHGGDDIENDDENEFWYDAVPARFVCFDDWQRAVYKLPDGRYIKDVDVSAHALPSLHYSVNNQIIGEPDFPVEENIKLIPKRMSW